MQWNGFVKANERNAQTSDRCQWQLLEERFEVGGRLDMNDVAAGKLYCATWGRSIESIHYPIHEFWSTYDEQGQYPFVEKGDDA